MEIISKGDASKALKNLKGAVSTADLRSAVRFAISPVKKEAIARAPRGSRMHRTYRGRLVAPGFLSRSFKINTYKFRRGGGVGASVRLKPEAYYGQFIGSGYTSRKGRRIQGRPFMRPAVDAKRSQMADRFEQQLQKRLKKAGIL